MQDKKEKNMLSRRISTIIGIVLCVIFVPILVLNSILLVKGWTNKEEVPSIGNISPMIVLTPSMQGKADDCFNAGDLIFIKKAELKDVKEGDVITFYDPDGSGTSVLTHRIVEIYEADGVTYFRTKGDNNLIGDPTPVQSTSLIGKYTRFRVPYAGYIAMFMQTTWGLVVCIFAPIILIVGYDALRRAKYAKKHEDDKEQLLAELEELRKLKAEQMAVASANDAVEAAVDNTETVSGTNAEETPDNPVTMEVGIQDANEAKAEDISDA